MRQNGCHFADDIFKCIFLNENVWIPVKISLKFVPKGPINSIPALVQIMAWRRPGGKPLSEPMMISLLTHLCVTQPQWVNRHSADNCDVSFVIKFLRLQMILNTFPLFRWHCPKRLIPKSYSTPSVKTIHLKFPALAKHGLVMPYGIKKNWLSLVQLLAFFLYNTKTVLQ